MRDTKENLEWEIRILKSKREKLKEEIEKLKKNLWKSDVIYFFKYKNRIYIVEKIIILGEGGGGDGYREEYSEPNIYLYKIHFFDEDNEMFDFSKNYIDRSDFLKKIPEEIRKIIEKFENFNWKNTSFFYPPYFISITGFIKEEEIRKIVKNIRYLLKPITSNIELRYEKAINFRHYGIINTTKEEIIKNNIEKDKLLIDFLKKNEKIKRFGKYFPYTERTLILDYELEEIIQKIRKFEEVLNKFVGIIENRVTVLKKVSKIFYNFGFDDSTEFGETFSFYYDAYFHEIRITFFNTVLISFNEETKNTDIYIYDEIEFMKLDPNYTKIYDDFVKKLKAFFKLVD